MIIIQRRRRVLPVLAKVAHRRRYWEYRVFKPIDPQTDPNRYDYTPWGLSLNEARKLARKYEGGYRLAWREPSECGM